MQVLCTRKASITTGKQPQVSVCHLTAGSVLVLNLLLDVFASMF